MELAKEIALIVLCVLMSLSMIVLIVVLIRQDARAARRHAEWDENDKQIRAAMQSIRDKNEQERKQSEDDQWKYQ